MKRAFALVGVAVGLAVILPNIAYAHHPVLTVERTCLPDKHVLTWGIGNSENDKVMTIISAEVTQGDIVGYDTEVPASGVTYGTNELPLTFTGQVTLTVEAKWFINGVEATRSLTRTIFVSCQAPPTTTTTVAETTTTTTTTVPDATTTTTTVEPPGTDHESTTTVPVTTTSMDTPTTLPEDTTTTTGVTTLRELPTTGTGTGTGILIGLGMLILTAGSGMLWWTRRRIA